MRRSHVRKVAAPNNASRMNPSIEPSMIKANSASISSSNTPVAILAKLSVTASPSRASTSSKGRRSRRRSGWQASRSRAAPRI
jgi:hypothetical protein